MIFNKKLLALVIAHFAFAQFVFASDDEMKAKEVSNTSKKVVQFVGSAVQHAEKYVDLDKAVDNGSAACRGCGQALIRVTRAGADLTLALLTNVDKRIGGRLSEAKGRVLVLAETTDTAVTKRIGGTRFGSGYDWAKATIGDLYSSLHDTVYPKLA